MAGRLLEIELNLENGVNARASLSPDMAIRLEKAFGVSKETLMRMQNSFDMAQVHERGREIKVEPYQPEMVAELYMKAV